VISNDDAVSNEKDHVVLSLESRGANIEKRPQSLIGIIGSGGAVNGVFQQIADKWIAAIAAPRPSFTFLQKISLPLAVDIKSGDGNTLLVWIVVDQNGGVFLKAGILDGFELCGHTGRQVRICGQKDHNCPFVFGIGPHVTAGRGWCRRHVGILLWILVDESGCVREPCSMRLNERREIVSGLTNGGEFSPSQICCSLPSYGSNERNISRDR